MLHGQESSFFEKRNIIRIQNGNKVHLRLLILSSRSLNSLTGNGYKVFAKCLQRQFLKLFFSPPSGIAGFHPPLECGRRTPHLPFTKSLEQNHFPCIACASCSSVPWLLTPGSRRAFPRQEQERLPSSLLTSCFSYVQVGTRRATASF